MKTMPINLQRFKYTWLCGWQHLSLVVPVEAANQPMITQSQDFSTKHNFHLQVTIVSKTKWDSIQDAYKFR